jgi:thiamine pyrophosphokinase
MLTRVVGVLGGGHTSVRVTAKWLEEAEFIIAADGGLLRCLEAGYVPDVVLGDFDSVPEGLFSDNLVVIRDENQDITDCAKLLDYCFNHHFAQVVLICTEGDLMDHQLDAIHSAAKSKLHVTFALERGVGIILDSGMKADFYVTNDARVSLIPISEMEGVTLTGVEWELKSETLSPLGKTSISNRATGKSIFVEVGRGSGYLFLEGIHGFSELLA